MATPDTEIVQPAQVSIIPPTDLPNLQNALAEMEHEAAILPELRAKAKDILITDASTYAEAGQMLARVREFKKVPDFKLGQFLSRARRVVDWLRTEQNKHVNAAEEIDGVLKGKMAEYKRKETAAAFAEQQRINEERRKAAEAQAEADRKAREKEIAKQVKTGEVGKREAQQLRKQADADAEAAKVNVPEAHVAPSIPKVSGVVMRTNWKFEVVDAARIPHKFCKPDEVAIGQHVRLIKDKERAEKEIPGIRCWSE
jgi:hypothetical protein